MANPINPITAKKTLEAEAKLLPIILLAEESTQRAVTQELKKDPNAQGVEKIRTEVQKEIEEGVQQMLSERPFGQEALPALAAIELDDEPAAEPKSGTRQKTEHVESTQVTPSIDMRRNQSSLNRATPEGQKITPRLAQSPKAPASGGQQQQGSTTAKAAKWGLAKGIGIAVGGTAGGFGLMKMLNSLMS